MHFDWWLGTLPSASCPSPWRPAPHARSAPTFSYQSHFDWQPGLPSSDAQSGTAPVGTRPEDRSSPFSHHRKLTIIWCDAALATLYQVFLTDHTLTGGRVLRLLNGTMVGLIADMFLSLQCVLTVRRFRTTSAHCDDRCHCAQQRASRTCPAAAPVWRLGCSCIFFTASN